MFVLATHLRVLCMRACVCVCVCGLPVTTRHRGTTISSILASALCVCVVLNVSACVCRLMKRVPECFPIHSVIISDQQAFLQIF